MLAHRLDGYGPSPSFAFIFVAPPQSHMARDLQFSEAAGRLLAGSACADATGAF
jgi:hypothetical protein